MRIKQVRNATLRLDFGGVKFLIDPYLAEKDAYPGFEGTVNSHIRNPRLPLRTLMEDILGVDAVIVTHTHPDHWDEAAVKLVPKELPLFAQHGVDPTALSPTANWPGSLNPGILLPYLQRQDVTFDISPLGHRLCPCRKP
jgi:L-ascorbate metabolism protein UlaG (beta-lactamase superfamily)